MKSVYCGFIHLANMIMANGLSPYDMYSPTNNMNELGGYFATALGNGQLYTDEGDEEAARDIALHTE